MRWNKNFNGGQKNIYIYLGRGAEKENRPNTHIDNISRMIYGLVNQQGAANTAIVLG